MGNTITENWVGDDGGGIRCYDSSAILVGNTVTANTAGESAGGIHFGDSSPVLVGNTVARNVAVRMGGIACGGNGTTTILLGNTISGNTAEEYGGGLVAGTGGLAIVSNCILWGNSAPVGPEIYMHETIAPGGKLHVCYSDVKGGSSAVYVPPSCTLYWHDGNIDAYPRFTKESWGDYRLRWGSLCIDAGHPDLLDPDGTRSDMGAHFFDQSKTLVAYMTPEVRTVHRGGTLRVRYALDNCHPDSVAARGIVELTLPNGEPWPGNPLEGPGYGVMPPESNWQHPREYVVPETCPLGTWGFTWRVGMPGNLFDKESFEFSVEEPE